MDCVSIRDGMITLQSCFIRRESAHTGLTIGGMGVLRGKEPFMEIFMSF